MFKELRNKVSRYLQVQFDLLKLGLIERVSTTMGFLIFLFLCLFTLLILLIFLGLGTAEYFSELTDSRTWGYFITSGLFLFLLGLLFGLHMPIRNLFAGFFVRILTDDPEEEEDSEKGAETKTHSKTNHTEHS